MIDTMTADAWSYLIIGLIVAGICYAWAADAILGRIGFGVMLTSIIAIGGGYGGLFAVDWALRHHQLPYGSETPLTYVGGSFACVTVLLFIKRFVAR
jgi:hypothetical protein